MKTRFGVLAALLVLVTVASGWAAGWFQSNHEGAWLGISGRDVDRELAEKKELPVKYGVYVTTVEDESPADKAELAKGDVIVAVGGEKVTDMDDLVDIMEDAKEGDQVVVEMYRDGKPISVTVTLGEQPERDLGVLSYPGSHYRKAIKLFHGDHACLGVALQDLSRQLGEYFGVEKGRGALIEEVLKGTPAEKTGLKAGDVITAIDGVKVADVEDVTDEIGEYEPGDTVTVTVIRDRKPMDFKVELAENDDISNDLTIYDGNITGLEGLKGLKGLDALEDLDIDVPEPPDVPDVYLYSPYGKHGQYRLDWDRKEFNKEMEKLKEELKGLKKELKDIRDKLD